MNIDQHIRFENITVNLIELQVRVGNTPIHFTLSELRVLLILLAEPTEIISFHELIRRADLTSMEQLQVLIARLRTLLDRQYIFTVRGSGYSFTASAEIKIRS